MKSVATRVEGASRPGTQGRRWQRADGLRQQLESDTALYTYGRPQLQAGRIAAAMGDVARANSLLIAAYGRGCPYDVRLHRDPVLQPLW
jgi:hypothetical protein